MVHVSNVWDRTTEFVSDNLGALVPVAILTIFVPSSIQSSLSSVAAGAPEATQVAVQSLSLLLSLVMFYGGLAVVALGLDPAPAARPALALALRRLPPALLVGVVLLAALLLLCLPFLALLGPGGVKMVNGRLSIAGGVSPGTALALGLYGFVLGLVMLWLGARLILTNPAIVAEGRGLSALGRSWRLTRTIAFKAIGVLILYVVVDLVATVATRTVVGSLLRLVTGADGGLSVVTVVTAVLTGAVSTAFAALAYVFIAKLYLAADTAAARGARA